MQAEIAASPRNFIPMNIYFAEDRTVPVTADGSQQKWFGVLGRESQSSHSGCGLKHLERKKDCQNFHEEIQIKPTSADFHLHSCSANWCHIVWSRNQEFSALLCFPPVCPSFSEILLSPLMLLCCLKLWLLRFIWPKWRQDSHLLAWFCCLILILSRFLNFPSLLASTSSNDIIPGGGIYSEELRASKNTPKNTKIVPNTFYSLAKEH